MQEQIIQLGNEEMNFHVFSGPGSFAVLFISAVADVGLDVTGKSVPVPWADRYYL
jgi:hypothetical protein